MAGVTVTRGLAGRRARRNGSATTRAARVTKPAPPGGFYALAALVAVLDIVGLAMVLSASSVHDLRVLHSAWYCFAHPSLYVLAVTLSPIVAAKVDYRRALPGAWPRLDV